MTELLRCHHCGDVIGVYEPLIALIDGQTHETSRAGAQDSAAVVEEYYHRDCYTGSQRGDPGLT
jgi:hypothetical protein